MSKRFLLLYSSPLQKAELEECEAVFKGIFRKFRKSVIFSFMEVDFSSSCRTVMAQMLKDAISKADAVLWHTDEESLLVQKSFAQDVLGLYCEENYTVGRYVFHIPQKKEAQLIDGSICESSVTDISALKKAVSLAADKAATRCAPLTFCTDRKSEADRIFLHEAELFLGDKKHLPVIHISLDEFIHQSSDKIPLYDVVFATQNTARIVSAHMSSGIKSPTGHTLWHTDEGQVYLREIFPYEDMGCLRLASLMIAFAGMLENAQGVWLKRCIGHALELCCEKEHFPQEVLREIAMPIRNRQVK